MSKIFNVLALLLLGGWAIGFFIYKLVILSHVLLALATLLLIIKVLKEK